MILTIYYQTDNNDINITNRSIHGGNVKVDIRGRCTGGNVKVDEDFTVLVEM
jgi:hypothetical protein